MKYENDDIRLTAVEQLALAGCYLHIMNRDIAASPPAEAGKKAVIRSGFRSLVDHDHPELARRADGSFAFEELESLQRSVSKFSPAKRCVVLVEVAATQPFSETRHHLKKMKVDDRVRRLAMRELVDEVNTTRTVIDDVEEAGRNAASAIVDRKTQVIRSVVGASIGAALGTAILAPHLGAAVGGAMGLSGAAATSAGLAALGFGSLASGGMGMVGGTIIVGAFSAASGGLLGKVAGSEGLIDSVTESEVAKLAMTILLLRGCSERVIADGLLTQVLDVLDALNRQLTEQLRAATREKKAVKMTETERDLLQRLQKRLA